MLVGVQIRASSDARAARAMGAKQRKTRRGGTARGGACWWAIPETHGLSRQYTGKR